MLTYKTFSFRLMSANIASTVDNGMSHAPNEPILPADLLSVRFELSWRQIVEQNRTAGILRCAAMSTTEWLVAPHFAARLVQRIEVNVGQVQNVSTSSGFLTKQSLFSVY